jgi:hypothetical protein
MIVKVSSPQLVNQILGMNVTMDGNHKKNRKSFAAL